MKDRKVVSVDNTGIAAETSPPKNKTPSPPRKRVGKGADWFRYLAVLSLLAVMAYVALAPDRLYTPVSRTTIFFMCGLCAALLTGADLANHFDFKGPGIAITLVGSAAVAISTVFILSWLSRAEESVVAVDIVSEAGEGISLDSVSLKLTPAEGAQIPTFATKGSTMFVVFPSTVATMVVEMRYFGEPKAYVGEFTRPAHGRVRLKQDGGKLIPIGKS